MKNHLQIFGWWGLLDSLGHKLPCPKRIRHWICDRYDRSLGLYDDEEELEPWTPDQ